MKKALVLMLAVLLWGTVGMATTRHFTDIIVEDTATFAGATVADLGTVTMIDLNGGTLAGITIDGNWTAASQTCADLGTVTTADINAGTWQGTIDGNWTAAGQTCADLGTVTTCDINGGEITGITDLTITDGGTGSSTAGAARTALGVAIGSDVQAWDAELDDLAGLTWADDYFILGNGVGTLTTASCTAFAQTVLDDASAGNFCTTLGLGTGDSPTFTGLTLSNDIAVNGGDITSTQTYIGVTTNSDLYRYSYTGLAWDTTASVQTDSHTLQVQNGEPLVCVSIDGGVAEIGSTEGYVSVGDDEDFLRFIMPIPSLWVDDGQTASFSISFDIHEQAGEECNIDIRIFEYANTTPIVTDALVVTNDGTRAWYDLDTLSTGFGAVATLTGDDSYLIIEVTATADTDDFRIYGARFKYRVGLQATL